MPVTEAMTAFDPKPKYTTERYQMVQSNDGINIKATLLSRPNNTSVISYLRNTACPPPAPRAMDTHASPNRFPLL